MEALGLGSLDVRPLAHCLLDNGRPALMAKLRELAPGTRPIQRHMLVEALTLAVRQGTLTVEGELPIDYECAAKSMPEVLRRAIIDAELSNEVSPDASLISDVNAKLDPRQPRQDGLEVLRRRKAISASGCAALRACVDAERSISCDSVDLHAEHQLNCSKERLIELIGAEDAAMLFRLPDEMLALRRGKAAGSAKGATTSAPAAIASSGEESNDAPSEDGSSCTSDNAGEGGYYVDMFIRRYTRDTRPWIGFHCDISTMTANVALNADSEFEGGRLLAILDGRLQVVSREEGEVTLHDSEVFHAVSAMRSGCRYTLIIFFYELQPGAEAEEFRATPTVPPVVEPARAATESKDG